MEIKSDHILELSREADRTLWEAYAVSTGASGAPRTKLRFPVYRRAQKVRVSEQEARFAFAEAIVKSEGFSYSVETPTSETYQLTGKLPLSAQTDLTVYALDGAAVNVEFKAKGASSRAKSQAKIEKDVQKLLREPRPGLWFHLLEGVNSKSIKYVLEILGRALESVSRQFAVPGGQRMLTIHVSVLRQRFSIHKELPFDGTPFDRDRLDKDLTLGITVSRDRLVEVVDSNGWSVHRV